MHTYIDIHTHRHLNFVSRKQLVMSHLLVHTYHYIANIRIIIQQTYVSLYSIDKDAHAYVCMPTPQTSRYCTLVNETNTLVNGKNPWLTYTIINEYPG